MYDDQPDVSRLGREILSARKAAGRSLRDVAEAAGISATYLQKLERAQVGGPSPRILRRLSTTLGVTYRRLLEMAGYEPPPSGNRDALAARLGSTALTETEERAVAAFIDHLVAQRRPTATGEGSAPRPSPRTEGVRSAQGLAPGPPARRGTRAQ